MKHKFKTGQKVKIYYDPLNNIDHEGDSPFGIDYEICRDLNGKIFTIIRSGEYNHYAGPEPAYNLEDVKGIGEYEYWWPEWMLKPAGEVQLELDFGEKNDGNKRNSIHRMLSENSEFGNSVLKKSLGKIFPENWGVIHTTGFENEEDGDE